MGRAALGSEGRRGWGRGRGAAVGKNGILGSWSVEGVLVSRKFLEDSSKVSEVKKT